MLVFGGVSKLVDSVSRKEEQIRQLRQTWRKVPWPKDDDTVVLKFLSKKIQ